MLLEMVYDEQADQWIYCNGLDGFNIDGSKTDDGKDCFMWDTGEEPNLGRRLKGWMESTISFSIKKKSSKNQISNRLLEMFK